MKKYLLFFVIVPLLFFACSNPQEEKCKQTTNDIISLARALGAYRVDNGAYPTGEANDMLDYISIAHLENPPRTDAWGNQWIYIIGEDQKYTIKSYGRDGIPGPSGPRFKEVIHPDDPFRFDYDIIIIDGQFFGECR
ncbi:MAG: type II secretion system protein GspG [Acidobacteria bacterium]|nr:type II secretion system protein GspG [Acidobacteriota bacterium]